jgi:predicted permease
VALTALGWLLCLLAGFALQRHVAQPTRLTRLLFLVTYWGTTPLVVFFAYTTVEVGRALFAAMTVVVVSSWLVLGLGFLWARIGGRSLPDRGTMIIATAFGNTSIVGYPLAVLVFGPGGLALAVVYSEFQFLIPALAVSVGVARRFAGEGSHGPAAPGRRALLRTWLVNPPVAAGLLAIALRAAGVDLRDVVAPLGPAVGLAIGLFGFVQIGLATPLTRLRHGLDDLGRTGATLLMRCGVAPLALYLTGRLAGVPVPPVFLLLAATPVAFHTMVLARVYALNLDLQRLLILVSTPAVIVAVVVWHAAVT